MKSILGATVLGFVLFSVTSAWAENAVQEQRQRLKRLLQQDDARQAVRDRSRRSGAQIRPGVNFGAVDPGGIEGGGWSDNSLGPNDPYNLGN